MKSFFIGIGYGVLTIFGLILTVSFILALVFNSTDMQESTIALMSVVCAFIAVFVGGIFAGANAHKNGLLVGICTSAIFTLIVLLVKWLGFEGSLSNVQWLYHLAFLFVCTLGSIIGVNSVRTQQ
ncbi:MAG: TIGR04086 family membrane protein [Bacilli bacterium]